MREKVWRRACGSPLSAQPQGLTASRMWDLSSPEGGRDTQASVAAEKSQLEVPGQECAWLPRGQQGRLNGQAEWPREKRDEARLEGLEATKRKPAEPGKREPAKGWEWDDSSTLRPLRPGCLEGQG